MIELYMWSYPAVILLPILLLPTDRCFLVKQSFTSHEAKRLLPTSEGVGIACGDRVLEVYNTTSVSTYSML